MAPKPSSTSKSTSKRNPKARKSATSGPSAVKKAKRPPPKQVKTKPGVHSNTAGTSKSAPSKRKQKIYTDKELNLPTLNMITPAGVQKPARGKKKGKIFVDDEESMMTILAMVNAEKEGQIESKLMRARQMEEIREARRMEQEKKKEQKQEMLEGVKKGLKRKKKDRDEGGDGVSRNGERGRKERQSKKRVSFA